MISAWAAVAVARMPSTIENISKCFMALGPLVGRRRGIADHAARQRSRGLQSSLRPSGRVGRGGALVPQAPSGIPLGSSVLMKRRVANVVPSECGGEENEQVECIVTDVFLRRLIIDLHCLNLVLIALRADVFFW